MRATTSNLDSAQARAGNRAKLVCGRYNFKWSWFKKLTSGARSVTT